VVYDRGLAERIRDLVGADALLAERTMFGGLCFLSQGNMCFGILGDELLIRVGRAAYDEALGRPHAREMDLTGRAMRGMVLVEPDGFTEDEDLQAWLDRGLAFSDSLPPK
jgi:hypothetical protein